MHMVGGGSRVHRGQHMYPGATRWMTPAAPKREISWAEIRTAALEVTVGLAFLSTLVMWAQILAVWLG